MKFLGYNFSIYINFAAEKCCVVEGYVYNHRLMIQIFLWNTFTSFTCSQYYHRGLQRTYKKHNSIRLLILQKWNRTPKISRSVAFSMEPVKTIKKSFKSAAFSIRPKQKDIKKKKTSCKVLNFKYPNFPHLYLRRNFSRFLLCSIRTEHKKKKFAENLYHLRQCAYFISNNSRIAIAYQF